MTLGESPSGEVQVKLEFVDFICTRQTGSQSTDAMSGIGESPGDQSNAAVGGNVFQSESPLGLGRSRTDRQLDLGVADDLQGFLSRLTVEHQRLGIVGRHVASFVTPPGASCRARERLIG